MGKTRTVIVATTLTAAFFWFPKTGFASNTECPNPIAKIVSVEGRVESLLATKTNWQAVKVNDAFCAGDTVRTLAKSRALLLQNNSTLRLDEKSTLKFSAVDPKKPTFFDMIAGSGFFFSRFAQKITINTPFVNASSEGTEFLVLVDEESKTATITVFEGRITATNEAGSIAIQSGESAVTKAGETPVVRILVRPRDAIQWALYYPPVLSLEGVPEGTDSPKFFTHRASSLLSVGRVEEAKADIEKALNIAPGDGLALSLQAIIAVVQDDKDQALQLALNAVEAAPGLASPRIALSYAHQAHFDLPEALEAIQEAAKLDPESSLVWSRMAELFMSVGELDKALDMARKAEAINPMDSRAQTVLGFAYLTQIKILDAKNTFEKVILLDQSDPLPRLGLGLATIRMGDLDEGRRQIEIAAGLDPNNAMIRSYLGKSFYDEARNTLAEEQLALSKRLDPNDPTPYFYDAIRKQTENRPVEALHDLHKSIERNDNRAVYRSRLLLDNDLAARSVSIARIYNDLGFQQLALNEGWKSLNIDPTNHSAHRFLADSYAALPRSDIARVSELLMAQLLQPLNNNPVQPLLGGSGSGILAGAGPSDSSMSEFNALFMRDGTRLLVSGIGGGNSIVGEEVILSGLSGRYSYSLGQFRYKTDGFRINNDRDQTLLNGFLQVSLTQKATIQWEFRYNETKRGDLPLRFDPDTFSSTERNTLEEKTYRMGLHYGFSPWSDFIASFFYQDRGEELTRSDGGVKADIKNKVAGFIGEVQHLFRTDRFSLIAGGGHFDGEDTSDATLQIEQLGLLPDTLKEESSPRHTNLYTYAYINLLSNATITLGGSENSYNGLPKDKDQFNPKFGLTWDMNPSTTLRIAGIRVLKRQIVSSQTLEPTQVAGFQQFFDDPNATDSKRFGIALDQRLTTNLFGGLELSKRDTVVPVTSVSEGITKEVKVDERLDRAYLYWTSNRWVSASAEYQAERSDSDDITQPFGPKLKTERVPLGLNFYHPGGLFIKLKTTFLKQEGVFESPLFEFYSDKDRFELFDVSIGYRLPKQRGILTIEAKNVLEKKFKFQETDILNPSFQPGRLILGKLTLLF